MDKETLQLLKKHFDIAVEVPDGIKKLRELILTLAMQGKLVEQDPNDQPASELLKEIEAEKKRLVSKGKIKAGKLLPEIKAEEMPYEVPKGWQWLRLPDCYYGVGNKNNQIQTKDYMESGNYPVIDQGKSFIAAYSDKKEKLLKTDRPVIVFGDHTKNIKFIEFDFIIGADGVKILCPYNSIFPKYMYRLIQSYNLIDRGYARHFSVLNQKLVPLPPLAEQRRIVAKIDQLMSLCDKLEAERNERNQKHITVHTASINLLLSAKEKSSFASSWQFIRKNFDELYSVTENVDELKKAILQLAVMGKLVPQDPNDQPASELLKEIEAEKKRLVEEGKIKAGKPLPEIKADEVPYEVPKGWVWCRLNNVLDVRDGTHDTPKYVHSGIPLVTSKNLYTGFLNFDNVEYISEVDHLKIKERSRVDQGDILFAMIGSIGNPVIVNCNIEFSIKNVALFKYYKSKVPNTKYIHYFLSYSQQKMKEIASGAVQSFVSLTFLRNYLFPLPPLAEQKRIVAKVDQLMKLCDELALQIHAGAEKKESILSAMLAGV